MKRFVVPALVVAVLLSRMSLAAIVITGVLTTLFCCMAHFCRMAGYRVWFLYMGLGISFLLAFVLQDYGLTRIVDVPETESMNFSRLHIGVRDTTLLGDLTDVYFEDVVSQRWLVKTIDFSRTAVELAGEFDVLVLTSHDLEPKGELSCDLVYNFFSLGGGVILAMSPGGVPSHLQELVGIEIQPGRVVKRVHYKSETDSVFLATLAPAVKEGGTNLLVQNASCFTTRKKNTELIPIIVGDNSLVFKSVRGGVDGVTSEGFYLSALIENDGGGRFLLVGSAEALLNESFLKYNKRAIERFIGMVTPQGTLKLAATIQPTYSVGWGDTIRIVLKVEENRAVPIKSCYVLALVPRELKLLSNKSHGCCELVSDNVLGLRLGPDVLLRSGTIEMDFRRSFDFLSTRPFGFGREECIQYYVIDRNGISNPAKLACLNFKPKWEHKD